MSASQLIIDDNGYRYRLTWLVGDDMGGYLGQDTTDGVGEADPTWDVDTWEHWLASRAVLGSTGLQRDDLSFWWETLKGARAALKLAREALKQPRDRPMPEWAKTALEAGWKPPKGWRP